MASPQTWLDAHLKLLRQSRKASRSWGKYRLAEPLSVRWRVQWIRYGWANQ